MRLIELKTDRGVRLQLQVPREIAAVLRRREPPLREIPEAEPSRPAA